MPSLLRPSPPPGTPPPELMLPPPCAMGPPTPRLTATSTSHLPCPPPLDLGCSRVNVPADLRCNSRRVVSLPLPVPRARHTGVRRASMHTGSNNLEENPRIAPLHLVEPEPERTLPSFEQGFGEAVMVSDHPAHVVGFDGPPEFDTRLPPRITLATCGYPCHAVLYGRQDLARSCGHQPGEEHRDPRQDSQQTFTQQEMPPQRNETFEGWREHISVSSDSDYGEESDDSASGDNMEDREHGDLECGDGSLAGRS